MIKRGDEIEKLVKTVRDEPFKEEWTGTVKPMSWDSSACKVKQGYIINELGQSDFKNMLNRYYIWESNTYTYCNSSGLSICSSRCNGSVLQKIVYIWK